jgi:hypothetical protein
MTVRSRVAPVAALLCASLAAAAGVTASAAGTAAWGAMAAQSRWVVDVVRAGEEKSERDHDAAGEGVTDGLVAGRAYRQASGWLRYTLRTFDDTDVTIACLCRGTEGRRVTFDLLVDGREAGTHTLESASEEPVIREFPIPRSLTDGKAKIAVTLRGVRGPTPGVIELRTLQEHLE